MVDIIREQFRIRIYEEGMERINKVLDMLTEEQVWYSPNDKINSVGNLVLHLNGNVTQWIGTGIAQNKDKRQRDLEFSSDRTHTNAALKQMMSELKEYTAPIIDQLDSEILIEPRNVQGFDETVLSIIIHVIEHFSYHVGQIAYLGKLITDRDLGFYEGMDLTVID
jgi:uncharacterized damage-inducible protein DinB